MDLILSSGFLAFAKHSGFLKAVDEVRMTCAALWGGVASWSPLFSFRAIIHDPSKSDATTLCIDCHD